MSQQEVADELGITKARVSQIEWDALRKLAMHPGLLREFVSKATSWARCDCGGLAVTSTGEECESCVRHRQYAASKTNRQRR